MKWEKLGRVYCPEATEEFQYAMFPVASVEDEEKGLVRIYYTQRKSDNYGFPTYMDCIFENDKFTIIKNDHEELLERNDLGTFDDSGVNIGCMLKMETGRRFYYLAWSLRKLVPFSNAVGVCETIGADTIHMKRPFIGPALDRTQKCPYFATTPYVIFDEGIYKMWFAAGEPWIVKEDGSLEVACRIEYAESPDGYYWNPTGIVSVGHLPTDHITTTPFVLKENGVYKMWYGYRGPKYRIGYAESTDGKHFERMDDKVGITVSPEGWDSEMVCYPNVFDFKGQRYLLYCGNEYGKAGFGLAKLVEP